jgi:hypothetical protein
MNTPSKQQAAKLAKSIHAQHDKVCEAVHGVLQAAGLHGVSVQSIDYTVSPETLGGPPIDCPEGTFPTTSNGQWFCKPL